MKNKIVLGLTPDITDGVKFVPPTETLPPIGKLLEVATITQSDVTNAFEAWKANPPQGEFKLILEAESG